MEIEQITTEWNIFPDKKIRNTINKIDVQALNGNLYTTYKLTGHNDGGFKRKAQSTDCQH